MPGPSAPSARRSVCGSGSCLGTRIVGWELEEIPYAQRLSLWNPDRDLLLVLNPSSIDIPCPRFLRQIPDIHLPHANPAAPNPHHHAPCNPPLACNTILPTHPFLPHFPTFPSPSQPRTTRPTSLSNAPTHTGSQPARREFPNANRGLFATGERRCVRTDTRTYVRIRCVRVQRRCVCLGGWVDGCLICGTGYWDFGNR